MIGHNALPADFVSAFVSVLWPTFELMDIGFCIEAVERITNSSVIALELSRYPRERTCRFAIQIT